MTSVQCILALLGSSETARIVGTGRHVSLPGWLAGWLIGVNSHLSVNQRDVA